MCVHKHPHTHTHPHTPTHMYVYMHACMHVHIHKQREGVCNHLKPAPVWESQTHTFPASSPLQTNAPFVDDTSVFRVLSSARLRSARRARDCFTNTSSCSPSLRTRRELWRRSLSRRDLGRLPSALEVCVCVKRGLVVWQKRPGCVWQKRHTYKAKEA